MHRIYVSIKKYALYQYVWFLLYAARIRQINQNLIKLFFLFLFQDLFISLGYYDIIDSEILRPSLPSNAFL